MNMYAPFEQQYATAGKLAGRIYLTPALKTAEQLVKDFPDEPKGYFLLNLVVCLCGDFGRSPLLIEMAQSQCPAITKVQCGDMQRDHLIGIARYGQSQDLVFGEQKLAPAIKSAHRDDRSRLACLEGTLGQLEYAKGNHILAINHHMKADGEWALLGDPTSAEWVTLNRAYWLRTIIAQRGAGSTDARELTSLLRGSNRYRHAELLVLPHVGVKLYDWLHTHRTVCLPL